jgi:4-hydroxyphenylpyruvate dioxygenase
MTNATDRELVPESENPVGLDGIEFIEFTTSRPQALGGVLERMGFRPIARHRSREVELYRQGTMNIVINSQPADIPRTVEPIERPIISALALRVRDADAAFRRALDLGAWEIPVRAQALELNIPGIHGVGESLIYFVDRYDEFSIFDIDFRAIPGVDPKTGLSSTRRFSAFRSSRMMCGSASCPGGYCCRAPAASFICN